jgi:hypothetical protein
MTGFLSLGIVIHLSTSICFAPPNSGCCLEVENEFGCAYETCSTFVPVEFPQLQVIKSEFHPNLQMGEFVWKFLCGRSQLGAY